jgi:hypothetical protein
MNLIHRRRFNYTGRDIFEYVARCLCLRKKKLKNIKIKNTGLRILRSIICLGRESIK